MKLSELYRICEANGVPPLLYKWSFYKECQNEFLRSKLNPLFENIESWLRAKNTCYVFMIDSALGSKLGVSFLKAAYLADFIGSRYTTPENICGFQRENWYEEGDVYTNLLNADFLVIDKVTNNIEPWQKKIWDRFIEDRLLKNRSTIFVGLVLPKYVFNERAVDLLKDVKARILTENEINNLNGKS